MRIREKLKTHQVTIGTWLQIANPEMAYLLARSGFDWVVVDLEHGSIAVDNVAQIFRAIEQGGSVPMARVAMNESIKIRQIMDLGARGIIVPDVRNLEDVQKAHNAIFLPPLGTRGVGFCRANDYGIEFNSYLADHVEETIFIVQIEHKNAVQNLEHILSHNRVDGLFIGPYDMTASIGVPGDFKNPTYLNLLKKVDEIARKYEVARGFHVVKTSHDELTTAINNEYTFIAYGTDAQILYQASKNMLKLVGRP